MAEPISLDAKRKQKAATPQEQQPEKPSALAHMIMSEFQTQLSDETRAFRERKAQVERAGKDRL